jgi:hypothetical protein
VLGVLFKEDLNYLSATLQRTAPEGTSNRKKKQFEKQTKEAQNHKQLVDSQLKNCRSKLLAVSKLRALPLYVPDCPLRCFGQLTETSSDEVRTIH